MQIDGHTRLAAVVANPIKLFLFPPILFIKFGPYEKTLS